MKTKRYGTEVKKKNVNKNKTRKENVNIEIRYKSPKKNCLLIKVKTKQFTKKNTTKLYLTTRSKNTSRIRVSS